MALSEMENQCLPASMASLWSLSLVGNVCVVAGVGRGRGCGEAGKTIGRWEGWVIEGRLGH